MLQRGLSFVATTNHNFFESRGGGAMAAGRLTTGSILTVIPGRFLWKPIADSLFDFARSDFILASNKSFVVILPHMHGSSGARPFLKHIMHEWAVGSWGSWGILLGGGGSAIGDDTVCRALVHTQTVFVCCKNV